MLFVLIFIGFFSILAQVVLIRESAVVFFGSEFVVLLSISFWMIGTGAGAFAGRRARSASGTEPALCIALAGLAVPATVALARGARLLLRSTPGAFLPLEQQVGLLGIVLAPAGFLLGLSFVQAARRSRALGGGFATAYGLESFGGVAGGIASVLLLAAGAPASAVALLLGSSALLVASFFPRLGAASRLLFRVGGGALLGVFLLAGDDVDRATQRWQFPSLLASRDSPYGRITLTERGGQIAVFENGALSFDTESANPEELVHLALIQRESPKEILLVGGSMTGAAVEARKHRPDRIDVVETDRALLELGRKHLPEGRRVSDGAPDVRLLIGDPRREARRGASRYDAVLIDGPDPGAGASNRFFTREFFRDSARVLRPGGVLAFRLASAEQLWTPLLAQRNASIHRALQEAFSDVVVLPGASNIFLASNEPLDRDHSALGSRLEERGIETSLVNDAYIRYLYTNDRFVSIDRTMRGLLVPVNSDRRPICYSFTILLWLSRFHRPFADLDLPGAVSIWAFLVILFAVSLRMRRGSLRADAYLVALAGFAGVVVEFAVLLRFQTASGVLYRDVGLLLAGFMGGLALSPWAGRLAARAPAGGRLLLLLLAAHSLLTVAFFRSGGAGSVPVSFAWLLLGALLVGAIFCRAAERRGASGETLYAADLVGGSAGALAGSILLLPVLGMDYAVLWVAAAALIGLLISE
jgi:spermidine synthase